MEEAPRTFIPAAGRDVCLPLYDPLVKLAGGDRVRRTLIEQAAIRPGQRVLDVGCGTGSLAVMIARQHPGASVVAIDPDARALARARRKASRAGASVRFDQGFADALSYPDGAFDRVLSSFVYHHVPDGEKPGMLREIRRVLAPGGRMCLLDFAGSDAGGEGSLARRLHSSRLLADNAEQRMVARLRQAGFEGVRRAAGGSLAFGFVACSIFQGLAPVGEVRHAS